MQYRFRALTRIRKYLPQEQTKAYIMSTFKDCLFILMFCGKTVNKSINKIHKRTLQLIYDSENATFKDLL